MSDHWSLSRGTTDYMQLVYRMQLNVKVWCKRGVARHGKLLSNEGDLDEYFVIYNNSISDIFPFLCISYWIWPHPFYRCMCERDNRHALPPVLNLRLADTLVYSFYVAF